MQRSPTSRSTARPLLQRSSTLLATLLLLLSVTALLQFRWVGQLADLQGRQVAQALQRHNEIVARRFQRQISELLRRLDSTSVEALQDQLTAAPPPAIDATNGQPEPGVASTVRALYLWKPAGPASELLEITADAAPRQVTRSDVPEAVRRAWSQLSSRRFGPPPGDTVGESGHPSFSAELLRRLGGTVFVDGPVVVRPLFPTQGAVRRRANRRFRPPQPSLLFVLFDREQLLHQILGRIAAEQIADLPLDARFALIEATDREQAGSSGPQHEVLGLFDETGLRPASTAQQHRALTLWAERPAGTSLRPLTGSRSAEGQRWGRERSGPRDGPSGGSRDTRLSEWYLLAAPVSGDLRTEVRTFRRRNLAVSLLVLGLLAAAAAWLYRNVTRAEHLADQQNEFLAAITHELQTPLTAISTAGANLADGVVQRPERVAEYGRMLQQEGLRLGRIVQQGLDLARSAGSTGELAHDASCSLDAAVAEALADQELLTRTNNAVIEIDSLDELPLVRGEQADWVRVIDNLIENAIKYGADRIEVTAQRHQGDESMVELDVVDNGPGIPAAERDTIWQPFRRGSRHSESNVPGTGLGLYLVRQLLARSGHRIRLVPRLDGAGSCFRIEARVSSNPTTSTREPT